VSWPREAFEALRQIVLIDHRVSDLTDQLRGVGPQTEPIGSEIGTARTHGHADPPRSARRTGKVTPMLCFIVTNGKLREARRSLPILRPHWALIRVRLAGICNTDVEILRGYHRFRAVPGHEFVGEVAEVAGVSSGARKQWLGKRVAGDINVSCSAYNCKPVCKFCRRGLKTHCARRTVLGIVAHDGAFAEYLALPLENLHTIPSNVPDEKAVFIEPLAAACQILDQIPLHEFPDAAVLGDGKLAQLIVRTLRAAGSRVTLYGKHDSKLKLARQAGIETKKIRGNASDLTRARDAYRLVVEATGSPTGLTLAQRMTEPRGTLLLKSTFHGAAPVEIWPIVVNEITVVGSRCGPFAKAIGLLRSGKVDPTPLISRVFSLKDAPKAILYAQQPDVMKVLLKNTEPATHD
jgi:threonine dehydrogenase-like Zn-dependent dehydrogenase